LIPYWLLFSLYAVGAGLHRPNLDARVQGGILFTAAGLVTILMIGLRFEVGGDWGTYLEIFNFMGYVSFERVVASSDPGYAVLNWLVRKLGIGMWGVNLACGLIFTWGLVKFAKRQPNPWLTMVVAVPYLIIVVAMGYSRQGVAIGFILAGLSVVERTSLLRFVFFIVCAAAFHKSAVIVLPLVALAATRQRLVTIVILFFTAGLLYYLFVQGSIDRMLTNYVEAEYSSEGAAIRVAMNLPPAMIFLLFQKRFALSDQQAKLWRNFAISAFVALALLVFTSSSTAVDRIALYLIPMQMFVLARLPQAFPERRRSNGLLMILVVAYSALIQFVWLNYADNAGYWVPYQLYPVGTRI
jgi:hypothetical protein